MKLWAIRLELAMRYEATYQMDPIRKTLHLNRYGWLSMAIEAQIDRSPEENLQPMIDRETNPRMRNRLVDLQERLAA